MTFFTESTVSALENLLDQKKRSNKNLLSLPTLKKRLAQRKINPTTDIYGKEQVSFSSIAIVNKRPKDQVWDSLR